MSLEGALNFAPAFVLVLCRVAAAMLFAPLLGSNKIPKRVRALLVIILSFGLTQTATRLPLHMPDTLWGLALGIGGEMMFGLALGTVLSFTFTAAQWAGEIIGQQMGLNMSEVFDPSMGAAGSVMGDLYFMFTLAIFLIVGGHRQMITGVRESFDYLPLLSVGINRPLLDTFVGLFQASTELAICLAAPTLVTMLIVDLTLGFVSKTLPQLNAMTAGTSAKSLIGLAVFILGLMLLATPDVIRGAIDDSLGAAKQMWTTK